MRKIDLTGKTFDRLTVVAEVDKRAVYKKVMWRCLCECGEWLIVAGGHLRSGHTTSCGCRQLEAASENGKLRKTHGMTDSTEFVIWRNMHARCYNENHKSYDLYGGRGILVRDSWFKFINFLNDMGPRPSLQHTLDRIDSDGPYSPENCRWATWEEQLNNRRCVTKYDYSGEKLSIAQLARRTGKCAETLRKRIKRGLSIEQAIA